MENNYLPPQEDDATSAGRRGCWIFITLLVIIALLGTSIYSAIWFVFLRDQEPEVLVRDVTATPDVEVENEESEDEPRQLSQESFSTSNLDVTAVPLSPIPPTDQLDRIVFIDPEAEIVSVNSRGDEARVHSDGRGRYSFPAWSPNGSQIAAVGISPQGPGVFVVGAEDEGIQPQSLYTSREDSPFYLYWAPDSSQVSFLANHTEGIALHVVPADASQEKRTLSIGGPLYWQWSGDSERMLLHNGSPATESSLEYFEITGVATGDTLASPGFFQSPGISSDGRYWAYAVQTGRFQSELVVVDRDEETRQQFAHHGQIAMSWSPAGHLLAFISPEEQGELNYYGPLRVLDVRTGAVQIFSRETVYAFFWAPDGRQLAALTIANNQEGIDINANLPDKESTGKRNAQSRGVQLKLTVYDVLTGEGRILLTFQPTQLFVSQFLPFFDQYALSHRLWSPTSEALVLPVFRERRSQLFIVPTNGAPPRYLADGSMPSWSQR